MDSNVHTRNHTLGYGFYRDTLIVNSTRRRQRRVANNCQLNKKKQRIAYQQWQANQIKIWIGMNEQALIFEKNLKNSHQRVDNE